jgi:ANTAR domain
VVDRGVAASGRHAAGLPEPSEGEVVIRRTSTGWTVEGAFPTLPTDTVDDLGLALVLADLLAEGTVPGPRPPRPPGDVDEVTRLRASVRQLEHALVSRVVVEQAIGVLSERWRVAPRDAFEQLRRVTRSHGLRIHDLAKQVIQSSADPGVVLPAELVPQQRESDRVPGAGAQRPAGPPQSPDGRGRGNGRTRRAGPGEPGTPAAQANGQRSSVSPMQATAAAPRTANGRRAHSAY